MESAEITPAFPINSASLSAFPPRELAPLKCFSYLCPRNFKSTTIYDQRLLLPDDIPCQSAGGVERRFDNAQTSARPFRNHHTPSGHGRELSAPSSTASRSNPCSLPNQPYTGYPINPIQVEASTLYRLPPQHYTGCGLNLYNLSAQTSTPFPTALHSLPTHPGQDADSALYSLRFQNTYFGASKYLFSSFKIPILGPQNTYFAAQPYITMPRNPAQGRRASPRRQAEITINLMPKPKDYGSQVQPLRPFLEQTIPY